MSLRRWVADLQARVLPPRRGAKSRRDMLLLADILDVATERFTEANEISVAAQLHASAVSLRSWEARDRARERAA